MQSKELKSRGILIIPIVALLVTTLWSAIGNYPPAIDSLEYQDGEIEVETGSPAEFVEDRPYRWITRPIFQIVISNPRDRSGTYLIQLVVERPNCGVSRNFEIRSQESLAVISNLVEDNKQTFKMKTIVNAHERRRLQFATKASPCTVASDSRQFYGKLVVISSKRIDVK